MQVHPAVISFNNKTIGQQVQRLLFIFMVCEEIFEDCFALCISVRESA